MVRSSDARTWQSQEQRLLYGVYVQNEGFLFALLSHLKRAEADTSRSWNTLSVTDCCLWKQVLCKRDEITPGEEVSDSGRDMWWDWSLLGDRGFPFTWATRGIVTQNCKQFSCGSNLSTQGLCEYQVRCRLSYVVKWRHYEVLRNIWISPERRQALERQTWPGLEK